MPALIIEVRDDGSVLIAAPAQIPPELMADAQQVASVEEAAQVVTDVFGQAGEQQAAPEGGEQQRGNVPDESVPGQSGDGDVVTEQQPAADDEDAAMAEGFGAARKGR